MTCFEARKFLKELLQNTFVSKSDKTKQKNRRGRESGRGLPRWEQTRKGTGLQTHGVATEDTLWRVSVAQLSVAHTWPTPPSLLPQETLRAPSPANQKDKLCLPSQRWQAKYSLPLKGNGCFCSFFKSLCSKQEELHVVSSNALHGSNFYWSIHCSHFQNPGGGGTGQGASFCFLFNGYDPFLQSKSVLDGDKYAALIHKRSGSWAQKALFCIWDLQPWLHFLHSTIINNLSGMMQEPGTQRGFACERVKREKRENSRLGWKSTSSRRHWVWLSPKFPEATTNAPWDIGGDQGGHFPPSAYQVMGETLRSQEISKAQ